MINYGKQSINNQDIKSVLKVLKSKAAIIICLAFYDAFVKH